MVNSIPTIISMIRFTVIGLNTSIKRKRLSQWIKKKKTQLSTRECTLNINT